MTPLHRAGVSRRQALGLLGAGALAAALPACSGGGTATTSEPAATGGQTGTLLRSRRPLPEAFAQPLRIPHVKRPSSTPGDVPHYEIEQRQAEVEIIPGVRTSVFGYDGTFPGPTIECRSGQPIVVRHINRLDVPTVVHLHGGHTPAESDGFPTDLLLPVGGGPVTGHTGRVISGTREYRYPLDQRAATLWYHDHRMDFTAPQVYRGLAGFQIVRDEEEDALGLPSGRHEVPLLLADRAFDEDGQFIYPSLDPSLRGRPGVTTEYMDGVLGDTVLVNGVPWPVLEVEAVRYRFRLLNASNARRYRLALDPPPPGPAFTQIGSDGGLLEAPLGRASIEIAPAERIDAVVDFSGYRPGQQIVLSNALGAGPTASVMAFRVTRTATDDSQVPRRLSRVERLDPGRASVRRTWRFTRGSINGMPGWTINNLPFDPERIDARPRLGDTEIWQIYTDADHPVHVHLGAFQVLSRGSGPPGPGDAGWKDTINLHQQQAEIAIRFTDHAGRYLLHCHNLEHEDMAMMAAFQTV